MKPSRYPYAGGNPPAPYVLLNLFHPTDADAVRDVTALADTGADITVVPLSVIGAVNGIPTGTTPVLGYDNKPDRLTTYAIRFQIRDLPVIEVEVVGSDAVTHAIVGRDVLNRYNITLDGPNLVMTISPP